MADNLNPTIFLSYAWANSNIADEIDNDFKSIGIQFRRDIRDASYRTSIKEFMHQVGTSDYVLMIISDEYLRSENCMYEVIELLNTHELSKRILPIVIENATSIFKPLNQVIYYDYWAGKKKEADKFKKKHANEVSIEYAKKCGSIEDNLPKFFQVVTDLNVSSYQKLKDENYRDLLKVIGFDDERLIQEVFLIHCIQQEEAKELALEEFLERHPENKYGLFQKAYSADENEKYSIAKKYYENVIKRDPNFAAAYNNLGIILQNQFSDYQRAKQCYHQAIKISDTYSEAHNNLGIVLQNHFFDYEGAKNHYQRAIKINPNYSEAYNNLATLLHNHFSNYEEAKQHFLKAIEINPNYSNAYYNLALLLNDFLDYEGAKQHYLKAIKINPSNKKARYNLAALLMTVFLDYENAKQHFLEVVKIDSNNSEAHYNLGKILHFYLFDYEGAKQHYQNAIKINPDYPWAHSNLGVLYHGYFADYNKARFHYEEALRIDPLFTAAQYNLNTLLKRINKQ